jgi:hypothetical protein
MSIPEFDTTAAMKHFQLPCQFRKTQDLVTSEKCLVSNFVNKISNKTVNKQIANDICIDLIKTVTTSYSNINAIKSKQQKLKQEKCKISNHKRVVRHYATTQTGDPIPDNYMHYLPRSENRENTVQLFIKARKRRRRKPPFMY